MNTGIQDAVNLGWKLASVLHGECQDPSALLESYDIERRRVGEHLLNGTDRAFQFGASSNPVFLFLRNWLVPWVLPWAIANRGRRSRLFRFMSQLGIRYRHSPVVRTGSSYRGPVRGGDRAPDGALTKVVDPDAGSEHTTSESLFLLTLFASLPGYHLVIFAGTRGNTDENENIDIVLDEKALVKIVEGFMGGSAAWARVHRIYSTRTEPGKRGYLDEGQKLHARYGFAEPGYVFVRPDGHVAHIGLLTALDELLAWLESYKSPNFCPVKPNITDVGDI
jgi:hypothetical protein